LNSQRSVFCIVDQLAQLEQRLRWFGHFHHDDFTYAPELVSVEFGIHCFALDVDG